MLGSGGMDDDLEIYRRDEVRDLDAILHLALELERWRAIRGGLAEWLVWIGLPVWVMAAWPNLLPSGVDRLILALWGLVGMVFLYAAMVEWRLRRKKNRHR